MNESMNTYTVVGLLGSYLVHVRALCEIFFIEVGDGGARGEGGVDRK